MLVEKKQPPWLKLVCSVRGHAWSSDLDWGEGRRETCARCNQVRFKRNAAGLAGAAVHEFPNMPDIRVRHSR